MRPAVSQELIDRAGDWEELHRWERSELGKALRRLGLTYGEIRELIPVPKATLSNWCREIHLTSEQVVDIKNRLGPTSRTGMPVDTQWRRRLEISRIRAAAQDFATEHLSDADFVAGVVLYWSEGSKTRNDLTLSNSDPAAHRLFVAWIRRYVDPTARFRLSLHLHEGNDEAAATAFWRRETQLDSALFTKTFIKPRGTGHRKNQLKYGVCRVRVLQGGDAWNQIMQWIDVVRNATCD